MTIIFLAASLLAVAFMDIRAWRAMLRLAAGSFLTLVRPNQGT